MSSNGPSALSWSLFLETVRLVGLSRRPKVVLRLRELVVFKTVATLGTIEDERAFNSVAIWRVTHSSTSTIKDRDITEKASDYQNVKKAFTQRFAWVESLEDVIQDAMAALLQFRDLNRSLKNLDRLYEKAGFKDEVKFGLLCNALIEYLELAQLSIYQGAETCGSLFDAIMGF